MYVELTAVGASSSSFFPGYVASRTIDGSVSTLAATRSAASQDQWISVQMPSGTTIGRVDVYNRADGQIYEDWLSPYEVWLGSSAGNQVFDCGGGPLALSSPAGLGPFSTSCSDRSDLRFVTVLIRAGSVRYLTLGEIKVFGVPAATSGPTTAPGPSTTAAPPPPPPPLPPSPAPPLSSLSTLVRQEARLSTVLHGAYPASNVIDGNYANLCASTIATTTDQWISVRVAVQAPSPMSQGTTIGYVAVYNRADGAIYENWLSPYELWLGSSFGDLSYQCGGQQIAGPGLGPHMTWCGGGGIFNHVTLVLRAGTARYLTITEMVVFAA